MFAPEGTRSSDPLDVQQLAQSGVLSDERMRKVYTLAAMFFYTGWHARGALEDADELQKLMGE